MDKVWTTVCPAFLTLISIMLGLFAHLLHSWTGSKRCPRTLRMGALGCCWRNDRRRPLCLSGFWRPPESVQEKPHKLDFIDLERGEKGYKNRKTGTTVTTTLNIGHIFPQSRVHASVCSFSYRVSTVINQASKSWGYIWKSCSSLWEWELDFYTDACGSSMQLNVSCRARETHLSLLFVEGSRNVVGVKVSPQKSWRRSFFHFLRVDTTYHIYPTFYDMHLESCCGESREGVACANTLAQGVAFQEPSVPKDRHRSAASHSLGRFSLLKANLQNFQTLLLRILLPVL